MNIVAILGTIGLAILGTIGLILQKTILFDKMLNV